MTEISRRFFLGGTLAVLAAQTFKPGILAATNIAKIYGDGITDDSAGFNALFANEPVIFNKEQIALESHDGVIFMDGGKFKISRTIEISKRTKLQVQGRFNVDAIDLPNDEALIFASHATRQYSETDYDYDAPIIFDGFDPTVLSNAMFLKMNDNRRVPLIQYNHNDPNFDTKKKPIEVNELGVSSVGMSDKLRRKLQAQGIL